jgi:hypothetical protein
VKEQKFGIEFIASIPGAVMTLKDNSPLVSKIIQRSGNPGYEQNMPLIVGLEGQAGLS